MERARRERVSRRPLGSLEGSGKKLVVKLSVRDKELGKSLQSKSGRPESSVCSGS